MRLYQMQDSGNCYKPRLLAHLLGLKLDLVDIDILKGESRTAEFLKKNPNGRTPTLELDSGEFLAESDAMLYFLAQGSVFWPEDTLTRAQVLQWMFFEQYSHEPYIAVARFWKVIAPDCPPAMQARFPEWHQKGYAALDVMETHLKTRTYFAHEQYTIADIALYAYTHKAEDGDFDLGSYPNIRNWLARIEAHPKHIKMEERI